MEGGTKALHVRGCRLIVTTRDDAPKTLRFAQRMIRIGSSPDNDLVLSDDSLISRRHCWIEADERGYRLVDEGSKNGTWIGALRVSDVWLTAETTIHIGQTTLQLQLTDEEVEVRLSARDHFGGLLGRSVAMREVFGLLEKAARSDLTVLVEGESGTGKELVAEALHDQSHLADGPFVVFDCSSVSNDLIESELFGHTKGAFTGAVAAREGAFEAAQGGTLFIDEVGELSLDLQPKLLRALERKQIRRVGGNEWISVDVRIVAATNRNLREMVNEGLFREDLYFRLAVLHVKLPALRDRPEDIPLLAEYFLSQYAQRAQTHGSAPPPTISFSTMEKLKSQPWPGNVRELGNFIKRAAALSEGAEVETRFLPSTNPGQQKTLESGDFPVSMLDAPFKDTKHQLIDSFERAYWEYHLQAAGGNISEAARRTGVHRKTAEYVLRKLNLPRRSDVDDPTN